MIEALKVDVIVTPALLKDRDALDHMLACEIGNALVKAKGVVDRTCVDFDSNGDPLPYGMKRIVSIVHVEVKA